MEEDSISLSIMWEKLQEAWGEISLDYLDLKLLSSSVCAYNVQQILHNNNGRIAY